MSSKSRQYASYCDHTAPPYLLIKARDTDDETWNASTLFGRATGSDVVRVVRGQKMRTVDGMMSECGAALQFFEGFGENWPALEECLCYLDEWLPGDGYVLVVSAAEQLLADDLKAELRTFLCLLHRVGKWWAEPITDNGRYNRPARPFHVIFVVKPDRVQSLYRDWQALCADVKLM